MFDLSGGYLKAQLKAILAFPTSDASVSATLLPKGSCVIRNCADWGAILSHWPEKSLDITPNLLLSWTCA